MIKISSGHVASSVDPITKISNDENILKSKIQNGSNQYCSSKGRHYKTNNDSYLIRIRKTLWDDVSKNGIAVGKTKYELHEKAYKKLLSDSEYKDLLPDEIYYAIFLEERQHYKQVNPNTGLALYLEKLTIIDIEKPKQELKQVLASNKIKYFKKIYAFIEKGSDSAYGANWNLTENIKAGDITPQVKEFSMHGADQANTRGFSPKSIDKIIVHNSKNRVKEIGSTGRIQWRYQDNRGDTVISNEWADKIVTVYSHPKSLNGGNYIPK